MRFGHGLAETANHEGRRVIFARMAAGDKRIQTLDFMNKPVFCQKVEGTIGDWWLRAESGLSQQIEHVRNEVDIVNFVTFDDFKYKAVSRYPRFQSGVDGINQLNNAVAQDPALARILRLGAESLANLNDDERTQFSFAYLSAFRNLEIMYFHTVW